MSIKKKKPPAESVKRVKVTTVSLRLGVPEEARRRRRKRVRKPASNPAAPAAPDDESIDNKEEIEEASNPAAPDKESIDNNEEIEEASNPAAPDKESIDNNEEIEEVDNPADPDDETIDDEEIEEVHNPADPDDETIDDEEIQEASNPADTDEETIDDEEIEEASNPADPDDETIDDEKKITWLRCPFKALPMDTKAQLAKVYKCAAIQYVFAERVIQAYCVLKQNAHHQNIRKILLAAVQQTLPQVKPESDRPHGGDTALIVKSLLPTVRKLFKASKPSKPSSSYIAHLLKTEYTFTQACEHKVLMDDFIATMMKRGDKHGFPIVKDGESIPTGVYDGTTEVPDTFHATAIKPHPEVPFCRYIALRDAVDFVRNHGESPIQVRARDMPTGRPWNNFAHPLYMLLAKYCSNQGYARTSDMARNCELFFFHGTYLWKTKNSRKEPVSKPKPFVFFLHKKMVAQRSRFVNKVCPKA